MKIWQVTLGTDSQDGNGLQPREDEGRERIPHTWAFSDENPLKSTFGSASYCSLRGYFKDDTSLVS